MDYYGPMPRFTPTLLLIALLACGLGANAQTPEIKSTGAISSALDGELFYEILLGELNARDGETGAAYALLLDAARKLNDNRLYQRAVDLALQAHSGESALAAARAWRQALPASREANRYVLQILIGLNRIGETLDPLKREVAIANPKDQASTIAGIARYFARAGDKKLATRTVEQALADYLSSPTLGASAWSTIARMRLEAGDSTSALDAARKAQAMDPKDEGAVLLALSVMNRETPQAEAIVKKYLEGQAQAEIRMEYARALLDAQRYAEAAVQIQIVTTEKPDYPQAWLIKGALELQNGQTVAAESSFRRYVELAPSKRTSAAHPESNRGLVQAFLSLAQIAEQKKDFAQAEAWLKRISSPEDLFNAQLRRASLLARQGKLEEARKLIRSQAEKTPDDARLKIIAEAQLLREAKQYKAALSLLTEASLRTPDDFDLLYDMAMVAEKLEKLDEMERLLRRVIVGKPNAPHAYNALGFSLAERNIRLPEAKQLILKALEFAPNDPFITDSLGWVEFRSGNLTQAQFILEGAFKARPDAEIASHLGEVLWLLGQREQAQSVWKQGVKINAENETLLETLKRLRVKL
jgi:tetratricopeptide (TPR) repeat protein